MLLHYYKPSLLVRTQRCSSDCSGESEKLKIWIFKTLKAKWSLWMLFEVQRIQVDHPPVLNNMDNASDTRLFVDICLMPE